MVLVTVLEMLKTVTAFVVVIIAHVQIALAFQMVTLYVLALCLSWEFWIQR
jgi:hypothetical protein